ncbi:MAG TPA: hypothetical protein VH835_10175 [Dongiaceae bacterium]
MNSRFVVKAGMVTSAAFAATAALQTALPVQADSSHHTIVAAFAAPAHLPLQCYVGGGGDVAVSVRVINQTGAVIPAGKTVSWTVLKDGAQATQKGSAVLKQNLAPKQSAYVGYTEILDDQSCTASVDL